VLILGRVGLGLFTCGSGRVDQENWAHAQLCPREIKKAAHTGFEKYVTQLSDFCRMVLFLYFRFYTNVPVTLKVLRGVPGLTRVTPICGNVGGHKSKFID